MRKISAVCELTKFINNFYSSRTTAFENLCLSFSTFCITLFCPFIIIYFKSFVTRLFALSFSSESVSWLSVKWEAATGGPNMNSSSIRSFAIYTWKSWYWIWLSASKSVLLYAVFFFNDYVTHALLLRIHSGNRDEVFLFKAKTDDRLFHWRLRGGTQGAWPPFFWQHRFSQLFFILAQFRQTLIVFWTQSVD